MKTNKLTLGLLTATMAFTGLTATAYGAEGKRGGNLSDELREQMHALVLDGDYDEYVAFATDNDLRVMDEERFEQKSEQAEQRADARQAALDGDYDEWRSIVGDEKMADINADNFYLITDLAQGKETAKESGDTTDLDAAKQALQDAGIEKPERGDRGSRGDRDGERSGARFGGELSRDNVDSLSGDEKKDLLERIINQIRERLGLN